ncbi:MAG: hypothetical protein M1835_000438 [Candelina submexicana]|nr:MAG: hypothetical protein M1835_000438 [Candelina submexicana]
MAVLITGGVGKTARRLASLLQSASIPFLIASRRGPSAAPSGMSAVKFDWTHESTFSAPFAHTFPNHEKLKAVYLVAPDGVADPAPFMIEFIDYALKEHGVKRYVLLAGTGLEKGGWHVGSVWSYLADDLAPKGVEWAVLNPTWFMENFSHDPAQASMIKHESKFYTATYDGKIPYISVYDIAAMAFHTLTDPKPHNTDYRIVGGELLTHDEIAAKLSTGLGRQVQHIKVNESERADLYLKLGTPEDHAKFLAHLETKTANGGESEINDHIERVTGKKPVTFDQFVTENKAFWT